MGIHNFLYLSFVVLNSIIKVENLSKYYGDFHAVKGISFEVQEGEIFGLLGPNGAGKSTTLEIIETLREKSSGKIWVDGFDLDTQAFTASAVDVNGLQFAALDLVQHGLAGDAEGYRDELRMTVAPEPIELVDFTGAVN